MVMMDDDGASGTVVGAVMDDMEDIDLQSLDDETQRFVLETHLENIGFMDFLGFELASLSSQHSGFNSLPNVAGRARGGGGMGNGSAFVTTMKSFIGMGILTLPFATAKGGLILGPLGLVCVAALSHHCMGLLVKLATRTSTRSFGALASAILGRRAKILVDFCLVLTQYGFAIADIIFIVENVLTVPVLMSNVVLLCGISWVYYCCFVQLGTYGMASSIKSFNWAEFPIFFGCAVFSFEGIGLILPIQFAMQQPGHFPKLLQRAMLILGTLFASFGMCGYAAYGLETKDMITFNIPQNKITSFLRLFYCLGVFFTYPVMLFPLYQITEAKLRCLRDQRFCWRSIIFRSGLVIMTGVIGLQIPHFGLFLGIIGSLACSMLAFVLPALLHFRRKDRGDASRGGDVKDLSIIAFGVVGGLVSFSVTLRDLISAMGEPET